MFAASKTAAAAVATAANYIEDVFSTYLYTGNSTSGGTQTITNNIDLSTKGGMVWIKGRSAESDNILTDTTRGAGASATNNNALASNLTSAEDLGGSSYDFLSAFNTDGFTVKQGGTTTATRGTNYNNVTYTSWTFREQAKFFDVVTYTGNGSNRTIAHSLGSVPGCIIVKRTDTTGDWQVYHRSLANTEYMVLNSSAAKATGATRWNSTTPTSTGFSLGTDATVNANSGTYVAYIFAHDAGGFGLTGTDNVISCGSYTGNGSASGPTITLGYEPQWVLIKNATFSGAWWVLFDNMRGMTVTDDAALFANTSGSEFVDQYIAPTATGFNVQGTYTAVNGNGDTMVYIAIRRGPMKTPTDATKVFMPTVYTGTNVDNRLVDTTIAPDMVWARQRDNTTISGMVVGDRIRSQPYLLTGSTAAEVNTANAFDKQLVSGTEYGTAFTSMNGFWCGNDATARLNTSTKSNNIVAEAFKRAPGFFDVVCYTGTGSATTVTHNLGVAPELMIVKKRSAADAWIVYANNDNTDYLVLNTTAATVDDNTIWNDTSPTSSVFTVGTNDDVNGNTATFVAYLFATVAGVSKVGSYTGTGTTKQIDCGFTGGARFVLIKRSDSTGDWYVWDSARGIVAGNDPYLLLNSTDAEVTNTDYVDTYSAGFEISSTAPAAINANGGSFIFLAIA